MVLIRAMNMFAIAGGVLAVERMVEHKTAASGSGGAAAVAASVVRPGQIEENSRDYRWDGQRKRQRCSAESNVVGSVPPLVAPAELEEMTAASSSERSLSSKNVLQMTFWCENTEPIGLVMRSNHLSIPGIMLKIPIRSWKDGRLSKAIRGMYSEWRRAQGLLPSVI